MFLFTQRVSEWDRERERAHTHRRSATHLFPPLSPLPFGLILNKHRCQLTPAVVQLQIQRSNQRGAQRQGELWEGHCMLVVGISRALMWMVGIWRRCLLQSRPTNCSGRASLSHRCVHVCVHVYVGEHARTRTRTRPCHVGRRRFHVKARQKRVSTNTRARTHTHPHTNTRACAPEARIYF